MYKDNSMKYMRGVQNDSFRGVSPFFSIAPSIAVMSLLVPFGRQLLFIVPIQLAALLNLDEIGTLAILQIAPWMVIGICESFFMPYDKHENIVAESKARHSLTFLVNHWLTYLLN